ncbi:hypothetical protein KJI95_02035 [Shewanella sp. JM162201]|uniref:Uncharacterized protein n=1 Tax=Shewanella jiangmenensis TaxID=2837387 RepID=A0ABS5UYT6_9GAMM|nr:hypothetical protein [Shewanella jiangmenensis]MBT1443309.1 hypothetical protein [Shewanella jiangmenensis]
MDPIVLAVIVVVSLFLVFKLFGGRRSFEDPKFMTNDRIIAAIAGQADWLEKISLAPYETQKSSTIVEIARRRRDYISRLCTELLTREPDSNSPMYPGASNPLDIFGEAKEYAKEIQGNGIGIEASYVRAVKEKLFKANGYVYPTSWEN